MIEFIALVGMVVLGSGPVFCALSFVLSEAWKDRGRR
jgi:hypothetical protein